MEEVSFIPHGRGLCPPVGKRSGLLRGKKSWSLPREEGGDLCALTGANSLRSVSRNKRQGLPCKIVHFLSFISQSGESSEVHRGASLRQGAWSCLLLNSGCPAALSLSAQGRKRRGWEATGWAELGTTNQMQTPPCLLVPPHPWPLSPTPCAGNAGCNLASKHRITENEGGKAPKRIINFCFLMQILWPVI